MTRGRAKVRIERVSAQAVRPLRQLVLRPGRPFEETTFAEDDAPGAAHFGAFRGSELLAVASLLDAPHPERGGERACQVRGMASHPSVRGLGFGAKVLAACIVESRARGAALVWCNAREAALGFYVRAGFIATGDRFEIAGIGPHFRAHLELGLGARPESATNAYGYRPPSRR